jgi:hypothetical protein
VHEGVHYKDIPGDALLTPVGIQGDMLFKQCGKHMYMVARSCCSHALLDEVQKATAICQ